MKEWIPTATAFIRGHAVFLKSRVSALALVIPSQPSFTSPFEDPANS